jgi:hypothetical protein
MIRKRVPKLLTILATAACIFGFVLVVPTDTPALSPVPTASAQVLANGYDVNCTKVNDLQVLCTVAGCPRVNVEDDLAGDQIHTHINGDAENGIEADKGCSQTYSRTIDRDAYQPFTLSVQGCRHHNWPSTNDCGAYSDYQYVPPPKPAAPVEVVKPVDCPPNSKTPTVIPPAQCEAAPPTACPEGSVTPEVPAGQQCQPPSKAITMNITNGGGNADIKITNSSGVPVDCAYVANKTSGAFTFGDAQYTLSIPVDAHGSNTNSSLVYPVLGSKYSASVKCTGTWNGQQVLVGEASQNVP